MVRYLLSFLVYSTTLLLVQAIQCRMTGTEWIKTGIGMSKKAVVAAKVLVTFESIPYSIFETLLLTFRFIN